MGIQSGPIALPPFIVFKAYLTSDSWIQPGPCVEAFAAGNYCVQCVPFLLPPSSERERKRGRLGFVPTFGIQSHKIRGLGGRGGDAR